MAIQVITDTINQLNFVVEKANTKVFVVWFSDNAIELKCLFFFEPNSGIIGDYAVWSVNEAIFAALKANNIKIPYPQRIIHIKDNNQQAKDLLK